MKKLLYGITLHVSLALAIVGSARAESSTEKPPQLPTVSITCTTTSTTQLPSVNSMKKYETFGGHSGKLAGIIFALCRCENKTVLDLGINAFIYSWVFSFFGTIIGHSTGSLIETITIPGLTVNDYNQLPNSYQKLIDSRMRFKEMITKTLGCATIGGLAGGMYTGIYHYLTKAY